MAITFKFNGKISVAKFIAYRGENVIVSYEGNIFTVPANKVILE